MAKELMTRHANIDPARLYIYGYSAGAVGALEILKYHPDFFSAAISICGATGRRDLMALTRTPIWLLHAADDLIVKTSCKSDGDYTTHLGSRDIYEALKNVHSDLQYTEYKEGSMKENYGINPHCSWVPAGQNTEIKEWLFSK